MGLQSALTTALTGMTAAETTIDVVGNNLANSNTVGFKASTAAFATQFLQTMALGSQPTNSSGGTNPRQIGLGTMVSAITPDFNQGTLEISSSPTDLAIQGDGFFMVEGRQGEQLYTRNGLFKFNSQNEMVTITGNRLLGYGIDDQFQIQRTSLVPITIPLGGTAVAAATENVILSGTLRPDGDVATTAQRIQTGVLGNGTYTAPTVTSTTQQSIAPVVGAVVTASQTTGGAMVPGDYEYKLVWSTDAFAPGSTLEEGTPSDTITATVLAGDDTMELSNLSTSRPSADYGFVRVYRRNVSAGPPAVVTDADFHYVDEIAWDANPLNMIFTDVTDDVDLYTPAPSTDALNQDLLSGNYSYYVTYFDASTGLESRPAPISGPINAVNGRIQLKNLPAPAPADIWTGRRIYRNLATDLNTFYRVSEITNINAGEMLVDNQPDATILANPQLDLDGPKINSSSMLVDLIRRDGAAYSQVFQAGTLSFAGKKGGRTLDAKDFTIDATTSVQELIDFMDQALGIQPPTADPSTPIPLDISGTTPGGAVSSDGRIVFTSNNGVDNAIDIALSGMQLTPTGGSTESVDLPWGTLQEAVGESAVTDFLVYDTLGIPLRVRVTAVMEESTSTSTTFRWFADSPDNDPTIGNEIAVGTGRVTFDGEGNMIAVSGNRVSIERRNVSSASPLEFELDFSAISGLADDRSTLAVTRQDGSGPGVLTSFIVGEDGVVRGIFSNGATRDLGQIRLGRFANNSGLEQRGENLYAEGVNSGLAVQGDPGTQGIGGLIAGAVELSNTDIGSNLIDLILASTMYRGNTRVITTAQQMIDELLSLRR